MSIIKERLDSSLKFLKEAATIAATLPFTCGYIQLKEGRTRKVEVHDHDGKKMVGDYPHDAVPYNPDAHGELSEWVEEGQPISPQKNLREELMVHRHDSTSKHGSHEYRLEKVDA